MPSEFSFCDHFILEKIFAGHVFVNYYESNDHYPLRREIKYAFII